jgi:hypothetical protein
MSYYRSKLIGKDIGEITDKEVFKVAVEDAFKIILGLIPLTAVIILVAYWIWYPIGRAAFVVFGLIALLSGLQTIFTAILTLIRSVVGILTKQVQEPNKSTPWMVATIGVKAVKDALWLSILYWMYLKLG